MILKPYQLSNIKEDKFSFFLLYGQNEGQKNDSIYQILKSENNENVYRYEEDELLNNYVNFISEISNKSFFEDKKIVVILLSWNISKILKNKLLLLNNKIKFIKY